MKKAIVLMTVLFCWLINAEAQKFTVSHDGETVEFEFTGITFVKKDQPDKSYASMSYEQSYYGKAAPGTQVKVKCTQKSGKGTPRIAIQSAFANFDPTRPFGATVWTEMNKEPEVKTRTETITIPDKDSGQIAVLYWSAKKNYITIQYHIDVKGSGSSTKTKTDKPVTGGPYSGTMERFGSKMKYSLSGCVVKYKSQPLIGSRLNGMGILLEGEVNEGSTVAASVAKVAGPSAWKKVELSYIVKDGNGKTILSDQKKLDGSASISIKVPQNASTVFIDMGYYTNRTNFTNNITLKVVKTIGPISQSLGNGISKKLDNYHGYMNFSTSKGKELKVYGISENENRTQSKWRIDMEIPKGQTITAKASGTKYADGKNVSINCYYYKKAKNGKLEKLAKKDHASGLNSGITLTNSFPAEADVAQYIFYCKTGDESSSRAEVWYYVMPDLTKDFHWDDIAPDSYCEHCAKAVSSFVFKISTSGTTIGCSTISTKKFDVAEYIRPIYVGDGIVTSSTGEATIEWEGEDLTLVVKSNSKVLYEGMVNGKPRWRVVKGTLVGENLKKVEKEPTFQMSNCTVTPTGTQYVLLDDGKNSQVLLLSGSMEVSSTKLKKKYALKPGQSSTIGADGKINVKKFDVQKAAAKYKVSVKGGSTSSSSTTTTTSTSKRYGIKTGKVTFSYTQGSKKGTVVRTFDEYGKYERVATKVGSTTSVTIHRGSKQYKLDAKNKTAKGSDFNPTSFLNLSDAQIKKLKLTKKGTTTIAGKTCTVYTSSSAEYVVWNGIVMKKTTTDKNGKTVVVATAIEQPSSVDENLFKVPAGYQVK